MTDTIRILTASGTQHFIAWLEAVRLGNKHAPPNLLLTDPASSEPLDIEMVIGRQELGRPFVSRYEFGAWLVQKLKLLPKTEISRNAGLWNWLALYFIDQLAPPAADSSRKLYDNDVYALEPQFNFRGYYRHAIRTAWLAVHEHGINSRVLLIPAGRTQAGVGILAHRGEIIEQLAARQWVLGSTTVIGAANRLYMDPAEGRPRRGAAGSGKGSPRRLAAILQQLELTYDLRDCSVEQVIELLSTEFDRWKSHSLGGKVSSPH